MPRAPRTTPPHSAKLFDDAHADAAPPAVHTAYVDGASRGNPGPASYAVILRGPDGGILFEVGKYLGRQTNNVAEYYALITALDYATSRGIKNLRVRSDSELLVRQMQGRYKVKSADLKPLHERASKLARSLDYFRIEYVPREQNRDADRLANEALDRTQEHTPRNQPHSPISASSQVTRHVPPAAQRVRAHYVKGVLVPFEPLDLPEGAEVAFDLPIPKKN
ncbi:MAG: reverse transcriptase-like protein [Candidatus Acidiferrales bacterium]